MFQNVIEKANKASVKSQGFLDIVLKARIFHI
jgi:hypothetical protein